MSSPTSRARPRRERDGAALMAPGELSTVFPSVAPSAANARRFVGTALQRWGCPQDLIERVLLLTSELVTNAYRHARSDTRLLVRCDDDRVRVEVRDTGPGDVKLRPLDANRTDGRGLHIVDSLSDRWGHHSDRHGTVVWFELVQRS
jgi:anti-sigma regulatory factor (Ser/Thr protein kinase)